MLQKADEFFKSQEEVEKAEAKRQALIAKQYEGKGYAGGTFGPSGMYRSVARDFLLDQNAKGIIKLDSGVVKALEDRAYISGGQPLMYPDPIRVMRFHYGDDVFEKIPLDKIKTGAKSEILDAMSKVEANPVKAVSPATPGGYMTPGEIKANIEELENIERMIKRREYRFADMTDEQIKNELEHYGSQKNAFEIAFGYDHPEAYEQYIKSKPEKKAEGGAMGLDYLTGQEPPKNGYAGGGRIGYADGSNDAPSITLDSYKDPTLEPLSKYKSYSELEILQNLSAKHPTGDILEENIYENMPIYRPKDVIPKGAVPTMPSEEYLKRRYQLDLAGGGRVNLQKGSIPKILEFLIDKLSKEKNFNKTLLEKSSPKAVQDLYIEKYGKLPSAEEIKDIVNKQLQNKGSMEVTNPKTGEVTTIKEPVTIAEKKYFYDKDEEYNKLIVKHKKAAEAHDQLDNINIYDKIAPDQLGDVIAEMAGKNVDTLTDAQRRKYYTEAQTYLTDFIKIDRTRRAVEKFNQGLELSATDRHYLKFAEPETKSTYKQGDIITSENFGDTPFAPDLSGLEEARKMTKGMSLHDEMNMVLNQYDKSMFIKNEQGMVDVANPENVKKMALLLRRDHPELYKKLEMQTEPNILENFDITGRKPNASGGLNYLMGF